MTFMLFISSWTDSYFCQAEETETHVCEDTLVALYPNPSLNP